MRNDVREFLRSFDIVDNAMKMRQLIRWNGRDLRNRENLAEHTHLVIACAIKLMDDFEALLGKDVFDRYNIVIGAMLHDSLELLRGDILSVTKDAIPGLRTEVDKEEARFAEYMGLNLTGTERKLLHLADLMACYKFIEQELRFPSNDFAHEAYISTKEKYVECLHEFYEHCGIKIDVPEVDVTERFVKGYEDDAGVDIILEEDVTFLPLSTKTINLNVRVTPFPGQMAFICSRTSAAAKGLVVATCPIDPYYNGQVSAIVHNVSNNIVTYKKGQAFCQYVMIKIQTEIAKTRRKGKRTHSAFGETGI